MYAVLVTGGKQYRVMQGETIRVEKLDAEAGKEVKFDQILMLGDGDGVNDCDDKCPGSQAGQTIGPDGCPVPVSIDLKGVNFDFDKSNLRPDAIAILNEGIEILKRYPDLRVEVAGHTDLCGTDEYNQGLSERRARAVYDYLTSNGIDAGRLVGPNGYGESRPLEQTPQTLPGCKSETNRRTELNVQN